MLGLHLATPAAVCRKPFGYLQAKRLGRRGMRCRRAVGGSLGEGPFGCGVKQCGAHFAQTQTHFREIV
jgi:hypothetical protein